MNVFDLRGPEFLVFYMMLTAVVLIITKWLRRLLDGEAMAFDPSSLVSDPYLIAHLRGGANETLRVAVMSLFDRGLIVDRGGVLATAPEVKPEHGRRIIEREVLTLYRDGADHKALAKLAPVCREYDHRLQQLGFLPSGGARFYLFAIMLAILGGIAGKKMLIGMERGRPIGFLVVLTLVSLVLVGKVALKRRTATGDEFLSSVQRLFKDLKERASTIRRGGATSEMALLAAAFGSMAVPVSVFPWRRQLFPPASNSSSSGCGSSSSSCSSSSCGGGGGCGGGGCGGCGS